MAAPLSVRAHADILERIAELDRQVAARPDSRSLYLRRGELHRLHGDWLAALGDYERATNLASGQATVESDVEFYKGRTWLEANQPDLALSLLDRFLKREPGHVGALLARSRSLARLKKPLAAVEDLTRVIELVDAPSPELYLERSRLLVSKGVNRVDEGLRGVDEGIARLGPMVTLVQFAVEAEQQRGRHRSALERLRGLPDGVRTKPRWLALRGDLLAAGGQVPAAQAAFADALSSIVNLPATRRQTRAMAELEAEIRQKLTNWRPKN